MDVLETVGIGFIALFLVGLFLFWVALFGLLWGGADSFHVDLMQGGATLLALTLPAWFVGWLVNRLMSWRVLP